MLFFRLVVSVLLFSTTSFAFNTEDVVPNEVIVKFKDNQNQFVTLGKLAVSAQLKSQRSWPGLNLHHFKAKSGDRLEDVISRLKEDPSVEFAEPNFYVRAQVAPYYPTNARIKVRESWAYLPPADSIDQLPIVAIIDSGLDMDHSVFKDTDRVAVNTAEIPNNGRDDDGNGFIDDVEGWNFITNSPNVTDETGHGTHVSGIVLGSTEDIISFNSSQSPRIQILPLKFLNSEGVGKTSDAIEAINYAISRGVKVINNSWGGSNYSGTLHSAFNTAYQNGIVIVAAAGNSSKNNDSTAVYPANLDLPSLISVAASTDNDNWASFSNYGPSTVHVFSPGVGIVSTIPGNDYGVMTGTSMAAPFVSGLAALMISVAPNLSGYQIKDSILRSGDYKVSHLNYVTSGRRINFENAVLDVLNHVDDVAYQPEYAPVYSQGSRGISSTSGVGVGFGCGRVAEFYKDQNKDFNNKQNLKFINLESDRSLSLWFLLAPILLILFYKKRFSHENKREYKRESVNITGQLITDSGWVLPVIVKDLSAAGAGLQIIDYQSDFKLEATTKLVLNLVFGKHDKLRYKGQIMRSTDDGFLGIKFKS
jgi:thermitase